MMKQRSHRSPVRRDGGVPGQANSRRAKKRFRRRGGGKGPRPPRGHRQALRHSRTRSKNVRRHKSVWPTAPEMVLAIAVLVIVGFAVFEGTIALVQAVSNYGIWGGLMSLAALLMSVMEHAIHVARAVATVRLACALAIMMIGGALTYVGENWL